MSWSKSKYLSSWLHCAFTHQMAMLWLWMPWTITRQVRVRAGGMAQLWSMQADPCTREKGGNEVYFASFCKRSRDLWGENCRKFFVVSRSLWCCSVTCMDRWLPTTRCFLAAKHHQISRINGATSTGFTAHERRYMHQLSESMKGSKRCFQWLSLPTRLCSIMEKYCFYLSVPVLCTVG